MLNTILSPLFSMLGWVIVVIIGLTLFKIFKPVLKGKLGEFAVSLQAKKYLTDDYILLNNCTLPDEQLGTTQIDHILLSPYGIFVIETKNYKGWIFGSERQKMWTQTLFKKSYKFQNPLHQNYKHQKVLQQLLANLIAPEYLHSIVVFMPECEFKTTMPVNVFRGKAWIDYVKGFKEPLIPTIKLKRIQQCIETEMLDKSWKTDRLHVANLKQRQNKR